MVCTVITATAGTALFGAVAVIGMIILLIAGDLTEASEGFDLKPFSRHLSFAVIPLLLVSTFIVIMKLLAVIS
jgi:hypothetical protein